jgi:hypothetical protein
MNSPGPLESDSLFLIVQTSALIDGCGRATINPRISGAHGCFFGEFLPSCNRTKLERFVAYLVTLSPTPTPLVDLLLQTKG